MRLELLSQAQTEVIGAWKLMPEAERTMELMADVAVQVVLDLCVVKEEQKADSVEH